MSAPVILSASHVKRAVADPNFYMLMPEFLPLKRKVEALHVDLSRGCGSCVRRRVSDAMSSDFVSILNTLSPDGFARLKRYVGAERLVVRAKSPSGDGLLLKEV